MGLFRKRQQQIAAPAPPPTVTLADLGTARRVVRAFLEVIGNDPQMRTAALAVSRAGGGPSNIDEMIQNQMRTSDTGLDRPWRWLLQVARKSSDAGEADVIATVALFASFWDTHLRGKIGLGDVSDMMLECPPAEVATEVYAIAVLVLHKVDTNQIVVRNASGTVRFADVLTMCSKLVVDRKLHVAVEVRETAQRVLSVR